MIKSKQPKTAKEIEEQKQRAKDYCEMIESKLRKAEHDTWMVKDYDHLHRP